MIEAGRGHAERDWFCLLGRQVLLFVKLLRFPLRFSVVAWAQQPAPTAPACAVCSSRFSVVAWAFGAKCTEAFGANSAGICCLLQPRATFGLPFQRHLGVNSLWTNLFQTRVHVIARATCATCLPQPTDATDKDKLSARQAASRASLHPASTLRCPALRHLRYYTRVVRHLCRSTRVAGITAPGLDLEVFCRPCAAF